MIYIVSSTLSKYVVRRSSNFHLDEENQKILGASS